MKTFEGDVRVGYYNPAYKGYKAFNFYAGLVSFDGGGSQEVYIDNFYAKKIEYRERLLLKKDCFENEKLISRRAGRTKMHTLSTSGI